MTDYCEPPRTARTGKLNVLAFTLVKPVLKIMVHALNGLVTVHAQ